MRFEDYNLDPQTRSLTRAGVDVPLKPKTFDLLVYLASNPQRVVTKEELMEALWPDSFVEESNLFQHVFLLRKAFSTGDRMGRLLVTVPGKGYQFTPRVETDLPVQLSSLTEQLVFHAVESTEHVTVQEETEEPTPHVEQRSTQRTNGFAVWLAVSATAAILAGTVAFLVWGPPHSSPQQHLDLVLSDIENTTGDSDFDRTLNQALRIDLEQSPFLNLLPRSQIRETLVEMQRPRDEVLTPALVLEICVRNNVPVMLHGSIAKMGDRYLLIVDAESCVSGKQVAGYKEEVATKEGVLHALDAAAGRIRKLLGESSASIEQFQIPITEATTPSLDALKSFSEAGESFWHGDMRAAQIPLNRAIALDPNFASAYRALGSTYYNLGDFTQAAANYKKAFELREYTTERERLGIEAMYYGYALNDYEEAISRTQQSLQIFPNVTNSWVSLANLYAKLGEISGAIDAAEHAHRLDPHSSAATVELASAYLHANRFADAKAVANEAIAEGKDHWDFHSILFQIAYAEHDAARMKTETNWGLTHQHANTSLEDLAFVAAAEGRLHAAEDDFDQARREALRGGENDYAAEVLLHNARVLVELEQPARAAAILRSIKREASEASDPGQLALLKTMTGDTAFAQRFLDAAGSVNNRNTAETHIYAPMVRAVLAMKAHQPQLALNALEPARPFELSSFQIPFLRAWAATETGMLDAAAGDYRLILDHQGVDSIAPEYSLSHLRLARVLALQKKTGAARSEYHAFLEAWKEADSDMSDLRDARRELALLH